MANAIQGRDYVLSVSTDSGATFNPIGGIRVKELARENPIAETTNQADTGNETSSAYVGYSTVTISGNGTVDTRTTNLYPYKALAAAANSATPVILIRLTDSTGETYEGNFLITSFSKNGENGGLVEFSISLQNEGDVTYTAAA